MVAQKTLPLKREDRGGPCGWRRAAGLPFSWLFIASTFLHVTRLICCSQGPGPVFTGEWTGAVYGVQGGILLTYTAECISNTCLMLSTYCQFLWDKREAAESTALQRSRQHQCHQATQTLQSPHGGKVDTKSSFREGCQPGMQTSALMPRSVFRDGRNHDVHQWDKSCLGIGSKDGAYLANQRKPF